MIYVLYDVTMYLMFLYKIMIENEQGHIPFLAHSRNLGNFLLSSVIFLSST